MLLQLVFKHCRHAVGVTVVVVRSGSDEGFTKRQNSRSIRRLLEYNQESCSMFRNKKQIGGKENK